MSPCASSPSRLRRKVAYLWSGAAYGSFALAVGYAIVSLYWAAGGKRGLSTLGGSIERLARSQDAGAAVVISIVIFLKVLGGLLALALVRSWGLSLRRFHLLAIGLVVSGLLIAYGAVQVTGEALVETGAIHPGTPVDWRALRWHLALWDMWFLVWGALLAIASWGYRHRLQSPLPG